MPTRAAASAHCVFKCSVGATTVTADTTPRLNSSDAARNANVVFPAPGVATAKKSCGSAPKYCCNACRCHNRKPLAFINTGNPGAAGVWGIGGTAASDTTTVLSQSVMENKHSHGARTGAQTRSRNQRRTLPEGWAPPHVPAQ